MDISFGSTQRGEEEGRVKRRGAGCDVCVCVCVCVCEVGSGKILAAELIRENIENSIRKK